MRAFLNRAFNTLRKNGGIVYKHKLAILIIFLFILYFSNNAYVTSGDAVPAILLPWAILDQHTVVLDDFTGFIITQWSDPYFVILERDHLVSTTPIVTPLLAVPFYAPAYFLAALSGKSAVDFSDSFIFTTGYCMKAAAMTIAVLSVVVLYLILKRYFDERWAFILSLCYGVCTSTWTISSQSLWQHGTAQLLIVCCYYLVLRSIDQRKNTYLLGIGALSALIFFNRPPDAIFLIPVAYYIVKERCWQAIPASIIAGLPFLAYNMYFFGSVFGGYRGGVDPGTYTITSGILAGYGLIGYLENVLERFISNILVLLLFTPISVLAVAGIRNFLKQNKIRGLDKGFNMAIILSLVLFMVYFGLVIYSSGWGYGPRYWTDAMPMIMLFVGWSRAEGALYKVVFTGLAAISFIIQAYGAYIYLLKPY